MESPDDLKKARWDVLLTISIGGLITIAIMVTAGAIIRGTEVQELKHSRLH